MDLWIRSQDREVLTKINDIQLDTHNGTKWEIKCNLGNEINECYILGIYKSKEIALEVLDEIQKTLDNNIARYDDNGYETLLENIKIYEMPKE